MHATKKHYLRGLCQRSAQDKVNMQLMGFQHYQLSLQSNVSNRTLPSGELIYDGYVFEFI